MSFATRLVLIVKKERSYQVLSMHGGEEEQSIGKEVDFPRLPLVTLTVAI